MKKMIMLIGLITFSALPAHALVEYDPCLDNVYEAIKKDGYTSDGSEPHVLADSTSYTYIVDLTKKATERKKSAIVKTDIACDVVSVHYVNSSF